MTVSNNPVKHNHSQYAVDGALVPNDRPGMIDRKAMGARIKTRREELGWTQTELSRRAHVEQGTISKIERGYSTSIDTLARVHQTLGIEEPSLFMIVHPANTNGRWPAGLAEPSQAIHWEPPATRRGDNRPDFLDLIHAICPEDARPGFLQARLSLPGLGVVAGDIVVIDLKRQPRRGEVVVINRVDEQTGTSTTVFRRWLDPLVVLPGNELRLAAETARADECRPVIAVVRAPELTSIDT